MIDYGLKKIATADAEFWISLNAIAHVSPFGCLGRSGPVAESNLHLIQEGAVVQFKDGSTWNVADELWQKLKELLETCE